MRDAQKYTETLIAFGQMVKRKLQLEFEPEPEPQLEPEPEPEPQPKPEQEEALPKSVEGSDPSPEPANNACAASDGGTEAGDDQAEGVFRDETVLGRIKRLFC